MKQQHLFIQPLIYLSLTLLACTATAEPQQFERCMQAALKRQPGHIIKVEGKTEQGQSIYEFDIRTSSMTDWDIECDAASGKITEVEQEVGQSSHPLFVARKKISESEAKVIALKQYPGSINEIEYEIEEDGAASYEFDIVDNDGKEMKIEVDAGSGKIVEANEEHWQIGFE